jgi:hypothetical protein
MRREVKAGSARAARPNCALQRTRPLLRFLLNLKRHGWGLAAEGWALGVSIVTEGFRRIV